MKKIEFEYQGSTITITAMDDVKIHSIMVCEGNYIHSVNLKHVSTVQMTEKKDDPPKGQPLVGGTGLTRNSGAMAPSSDFFDPWLATNKLKKSNTSICIHSWKEYIGAVTDVFDYCSKCGVKKDEA